MRHIQYILSNPAVIWNRSIYFTSLFNELLNNRINIFFVKIRDINAFFNTEVVASHHSGLSIQTLTNDEREVRILCLNVTVVVQDVLPIDECQVLFKQIIELNNLPYTLRVRGCLAEYKAKLSDTLRDLVSPAHIFFIIIFYN